MNEEYVLYVYQCYGVDVDVTLLKMTIGLNPSQKYSRLGLSEKE